MGGCCGVCSCHVHTSCVPRAAVRCRPVCSPRFSALSVSGSRARLASGFSKGRWFVGVGSCIASFRDGSVRGRPFRFRFRCHPVSWCVSSSPFAFAVAPLRGAIHSLSSFSLLLSLSPRFVEHFVVALFAFTLAPLCGALRCRQFAFFPLSPLFVAAYFVRLGFFCFFCQLFLFFYNASFLSNKLFHTYCTARTSL